MNIFYLDSNLKLNAQYMVDKHIVKMPLESAQLLTSALYFTGQGNESPYKLTHKNHPCSVWCRQSLSNWLFLKELALEICYEYTYRYGKIHKCQDVIESLPIPNLKDKGLTKLPNCMDKECIICNDTIVNYRNYYCSKKSHLAKWTKREKPFWYKEEDVRVKEIKYEN